MNDEADSRMVRLPVREMRDEPAPQRASQEGDLPPRPVVRLGKKEHQQQWFTWREVEAYARLALAAAGGGVPQANSIQRRAASLHIKTGMPWDEAEQLALSEAGIDDEAIDELIGECGYSGLESLLTTPDELRRFTRSVLVHQPLASSPQPEAAPAVAQVPSACTYPDCKGKEPSDGDCCKTPVMTQVPLEQRDWVERVRDDILYPLAHRESDELSPIAEGLGQSIPNLLEMSAPEAPAQAAPSAGEVERELLLEALDIQRRTLGHGTELHLAMIDWALRASATLSHKEQP